MKIIARFCLITLSLFICSNSGAQVFSASIGATCPDLEFTNVINFKTTKAKLSDFEGKLLILDFWATWCSPCVAAFPKINALQSKFNDQLQILPVTDQDEKTVTDFFAKMKKETNNIIPPSVVGDKLLKKIFPHQEIPHYVWIDSKGKIVAITGGEEITEDNIKMFVNNENIRLSTKKDIIKNVNVDLPIFSLNIPANINGQSHFELVDDNKILFQSSITKYIEGFHGYSKNEPNRFTAVNTSIINLYKYAIGQFKVDFISNQRLSLKIKDSILLRNLTGVNARGNKFQDWAKDYAFCYELRVPKNTTPEDKFNRMLQDLNNYFGNIFQIEGKLEKMKRKSLVLIKLPNKKITPSNGIPEENYNAYYYSMKNQPLNLFFTRMATYFFQNLDLPLINESNISENIDLELNCNMSNVSSINQALEKYGLKFIESEREVDMICIYSKK